MTINGIGYGSAVLAQSVQTINNQLSNLQTQLSTGVKSTNYAGMGVNEGLAIAARAQLSSLSAFSDTATNVTTTINTVNTALQSLSAIGQQVQDATSTSDDTLNSNGQTVAQQSALAELSSMVGMLNTQAGDRYVFSGSAINTPSVVSADTILNGTGSQAGLKQVIDERQQADLGSNGLGRLVISSPSTTSVSVAEDVAGSPFGLKLNSVSSSLTGATVTGPTGSPAAVSVDLGTTNPSDGDQISFTFNLPDGTTASVQLTASSANPPPSGSFAIGATPSATAANLNAVLTSSIGTLANTTLVAASAVQASNNFFSSSPPQRVNGPPFDTATSLVNGTSANTVSWYTGGTGTGSARSSATARVDQSVTVQYGAQANEDAIRTQLQNVALLAATSESATDPNAAGQIDALNSRVTQNLAGQPGQQSIQDMESDFSTALSTIKDASTRQTQTQSMLQTMVDQTEGVSSDQIATQLLALQTQLQASYQTTAMLSQLSLTKFLPLA